jgi:general secretion pathway protein C
MMLRFSERSLTWLNLLLIAVLAYFLALSVNDIIRGRLSASADLQLPAMTGLKVATAQNYPRAYYDAIAKRDIFNLAPAPEQEAPPAKLATNLHVKLVGTSHLTLSSPFIILQNENNARQSLYRLGDEIPGVGKLIGVYKSEAIILRDGQRIKLKMPSQPGVPGASEASLQRPFWGMRRFGPQFPGASGVHRVGPNRYAVNRSALNSNLKNMASLFTQIRAIPNIGANGRSDGFKLSEIQPNSIFQQIGLQDGDVLTNVEGQSVSNPMRAMQLLSSLRDRSSINVTVLRNGQPIQLQYNIH